MNFTSKQKMFVIIMAVYCSMLIVSNTIANRTFNIGNFMMTSAVIVFPVIYIVNDVVTECFGFKNAKLMIGLGFILNLLAVAIYNVCINMPTTNDFTAYNVVFSSTLRATIVSFCGYLAGGFTNAIIMKVMKQKSEKWLMARCVVSTLFGELADSAIFSIGMFVGILSGAQIVTMIINYVIVKTVYEIIVYPVTKKIIKHVKAME